MQLPRIPKVFWLLIAVSLAFVPATACEQNNETEPDNETKPALPQRGIFVRRKGDDRFRFLPWEGEQKVNQLFRDMRKWDEGGEVFFAPGTYTLEQGFYIQGVKDLTISGTAGVSLEFAQGPKTIPYTIAPVERRAKTIMVDRPGDLVPGWNYQCYAPDRKGDRILEFGVARVEGGVAYLKRPVRYMPHVKEIPAGSPVYVEVNIFQVRKCPGLVIQNLSMNGHKRGEIRGHTIYTGLYIIGDYKHARRPVTHGLIVRGNTLRGFNGRGVVYYNIADALIENNTFYDIRAQAIEVDHFATGHVINNYVDGAETGVTLNDTFDAIVEGNVLRNCRVAGVYFMMTHEEPRWANSTNLVQDNWIVGCKRGVAFRDKVTGNTVRGNYISDLPDPSFEIWNSEGNDVTYRER